MRKLRAMIVDNDQDSRKVLRNVINLNFQQIELLSDCKTVPEAVKKIKKHKPDIVFLEIDLPEYNGFDLMNFFDEHEVTFKIIIITRHGEYSLKAFENNAVAYIIKPLRIEELDRAIKKATVKFADGNPNDVKPIETQNLLLQDKKILLQTTDMIFVVKHDDIIYFQAKGSYTKAVTTSQGELYLAKKLLDFEYLEAMGGFFRTHRSFIINVNHIKKLDKKDYLITLSNDVVVQLSQEKKQQLLDKLTFSN